MFLPLKFSTTKVTKTWLTRNASTFTSLKGRCKVSLGLHFVSKILSEPECFPIPSCMKFYKVPCTISFRWLKLVIRTAQEENISVSAWKHASAKQVRLIKFQQAWPTNSKHAHTRTHTAHTYTGQNTQNVMLSCLTQKEVDVVKIGFNVVGENAYGGKIIMKAVSLVRSITSPRKWRKPALLCRKANG